MPLGGAIVVLNVDIKCRQLFPKGFILLFMEILTDVILFLRMKKRGSDWDPFLTTPHTCCNRWSKVGRVACQGVFDNHF